MFRRRSHLEMIPSAIPILIFQTHDSAALVQRSPNLNGIKKGQAPDLSKRNPTSGLPLTKCPERRLALPIEYFIDAR
jgi:hypothetical protein